MHPLIIKKPSKEGFFVPTILNMFSINQYSRVLKRFSFLLIPYSFLRIGFYFYHFDTYRRFTQDQILESFLLGVRFDVAAICLINIPILFLSIFCIKKSPLIFFERLLFVLLNSIGILASLDDYELYSFMGKRLSLDLFVITDDIWDQLPQLALNYWYFPILSLLFGICFYYFDKNLFLLKKSSSRFVVWLGTTLVVLGIAFIGIRGGLQLKSINVQSAFTQGENELGHLVLNSPYHFLRTLKNKSITKRSYFINDEKAIDVILSRRDFNNHKISKNPKNVVIIILESFSSEYLEEGLTPFFNDLIKEGQYFSKHLANGRRSIEALPSILCGLPSLLEEPVSKSSFSSNKFVCLPKILKKEGYTNYFFHGGSKGTMGFESYTLSSGFDRYFSRNDYPSNADFDGTWGIFDGPFMQFAAEKIGKMPEPFMAGIFTLSSHQPYSVPREFKGKFPKGTLEIHESIGYTDYSLKLFFEKIKGEPWFKNTIFVLTADHTSKLHSRKYLNKIGTYRVPLLILGSNENIIDTNKISQHSDIPKTLTSILGIDGDELPATSGNLWSQDSGGALLYIDGQEYLYVGAKEILSLKNGIVQEAWDYDWESGTMKRSGKSKDPLLKAYLQYFFNGLINNNLSIYR